MCPTFPVTGEEYMSTRGRANLIRAALEGRVEGHDPLRARELEDALSNCLSCKACTSECPSNVNLALLKAELIHARHERDGLPWQVRMLSAVDLLGRLGCVAAGLGQCGARFSAAPRSDRNDIGTCRPKRPLPPLRRRALRSLVR